MSIDWQVLGKPGSDNALLVTVDSGQSRETLLFDCGEGVLNSLKVSAIQSIEHLLFSHYHMDHVAGFDTFFRHNYNRPGVPVNVWGPPGSIDIMGHRFNGFSWNLHARQPGEWLVREIGESTVQRARYVTSEAFSTAHRFPEETARDAKLFSNSQYHVESMLLPHGTIPSVAYKVVEQERRNINPDSLLESGLSAGPWLQAISDASRSDGETFEIDGTSHSLGDLRSQLLIVSPGESIAYLTDFRVEPGSQEWEKLVSWLSGTKYLICECQYLSADEQLARNNGHMNADLVGQLAKEAKVERLCLHHLSRRYSKAEWFEMLSATKSVFPATEFPAGWFSSN
ncbi:MAG: ribonuclease Z [Verrucomicrobiales bacterium]|nr:ribonuclease Z [Verrucomicrobiales bacterium]